MKRATDKIEYVLSDPPSPRPASGDHSFSAFLSLTVGNSSRQGSVRGRWQAGRQGERPARR